MSKKDFKLVMLVT